MEGYILEMFGVSLALTLVLEFLVLFLLKEGSRKNIVLLVLVNILTNPAAVFISLLGNVFGGVGRQIWFQIPIEIAVVLLEAGIYWMFSKEKDWEICHPIWLAVVANTVSWLSGVVIQILRTYG